MDQEAYELAIEHDSAWDDFHEQHAGSALNPEYEAWCAAMQAWDPAWPLDPEPEAGE